jgi:hypothetical protein
MSASLLAENSARPNFTGKWLLDTAKSQVRSKTPATVWDIHETDKSISIDEPLKGKTESLKCELGSTTCKTNMDGKPAEVTFYYNGDVLVEMDFLGEGKDHVVKKHFKLALDGKTLEIEVLYINPAEPPEKWVFARQ